jgi:hypothetical protein
VIHLPPKSETVGAVVGVPLLLTVTEPAGVLRFGRSLAHLNCSEVVVLAGRHDKERADGA